MVASSLGTYNDALSNVSAPVNISKSKKYESTESPRHSMIIKHSCTQGLTHKEATDSSIKVCVSDTFLIPSSNFVVIVQAYKNVLNELIDTEQKYVCDLLSTITVRF